MSSLHHYPEALGVIIDRDKQLFIPYYS